MNQLEERTLQANAVMADALAAFGSARQIDKCIEELGELATVLMKCRHGEASASDVIDELADVAIVGETMKILFDPLAVDARIAVKLARLKRLVADQVASKAQENPFRKLVKEPKPGETNCGDCMWWGAQGRRDQVGVCMHQSRASRDRGYMAGADCSLAKPEPKPVKPVLRWEHDGDVWRLHFDGDQSAVVAHTGTTDRWYETVAFTIHETTEAAMRATESALGLPEVPLWKP